MDLYEKIVNHEAKISLIGLGYVGLPLAVAFSKKASVIGFDVNREKIELYQRGIDRTNEVEKDDMKDTTVEFTYDESDLKRTKFHIIAVPTPVDRDHITGSEA
jgi:UDP-N-acetyl-D-glucosamine/UDP-N-acetyl-D-galactosamine dehydrogenase